MGFEICMIIAQIFGIWLIYDGEQFQTLVIIELVAKFWKCLYLFIGQCEKMFTESLNLNLTVTTEFSN